MSSKSLPPRSVQLLGLSDAFATNLTVLLPEGTFDYKVSNLTAGASFQVQAYTIFKEKESLAYTSRNFTTSKFSRATDLPPDLVAVLFSL